MANNVFANGREIACKVADGKTIAAFPDVCFTFPPIPPKVGVPLPYPNTVFAKDTKNGSRSVFISGKEIMLKDKSYFKTSTGNEPARGSEKKGIVTGVTEGKAFFASWSMNVFVEGKNVVRHLDMTTHNHGSVANGSPAPYVDTDDANASNVCKKDVNRAKLACSNKEKQTDGYSTPIEVKEWVVNAKGEEVLEDVLVPNIGWQEKHCEGIEQVITYKRIEKEIIKLKKDLKITGDITLSNIKSQTKLNASQKLLVKEIKGYLYKKNGLQHADNAELKKAITRKRNNERTKNIEGIKFEEINSCLRARRCILVPYEQKLQGRGTHKNRTRKEGSQCCPGQTGHHILEDHIAKVICTNYEGRTLEKKTDKNGNDKLDEDGNIEYKKVDGKETLSAPVVCAEGPDQAAGGSHQYLHDMLKKLLKDRDKEKDKESPDAFEIFLKIALDSHEETFRVGKKATCNRECIEQQLRYYFEDKKCEGEIQKESDDNGREDNDNIKER